MDNIARLGESVAGLGPALAGCGWVWMIGTKEGGGHRTRRILGDWMSAREVASSVWVWMGVIGYCGYM